MRLLQILLAALVAATLLAACTPPAAQPTPDAGAPAAEQPAATAGAAYPGPAAAGAAYPGPQGQEPAPTASMDPIVVPTPSSGEVGVVAGTLYRVDEGGNRVPYPAATIYLGTVTASGGVDAMVALDRTTAPAAITNGLGQFAFADVPPGRYGLMLQSLEGALLLNNPDDGGDMVIEVAGGQTVEMGELAYPLPNPLE
jgi:hypothetical protein